MSFTTNIFGCTSCEKNRQFLYHHRHTISSLGCLVKHSSPFILRQFLHVHCIKCHEKVKLSDQGRVRSSPKIRNVAWWWDVIISASPVSLVLHFSTQISLLEDPLAVSSMMLKHDPLNSDSNLSLTIPVSLIHRTFQISSFLFGSTNAWYCYLPRQKTLTLRSLTEQKTRD